MVQMASMVHTERISHLFIAVVERLVTGEVLQSYGPDAITSSQLSALRFLASRKAPLMGEIAAGLRISLPAATKAMDRLVKKELASRVEDKSDRRVVRIELTAKGWELLKEICTAQTRSLSKIIDAMPEEDKADFVKGIESFIKAAITDEEVIAEICLHCGEAHTEDCIAVKELARVRGTLTQPQPVNTDKVG